MTKKSLLKSNISVVVIAFFLSFAVYSLAVNYTDVATNIQGAIVTPEITGDLAVSVEDDLLVVTAQKSIVAVIAISVLALYDTDAINWSDDALQTSFASTIAANQPGEVSIVLDTRWSVDFAPGDVLFSLAINGDPYAMSFSNIAVTFAGGETEAVSFAMP